MITNQTIQQGNAFKEYRTICSRMKWGTKSVGERMVNKKVSTNSTIGKNVLGWACITYHMARPVTAMT